MTPRVSYHSTLACLGAVAAVAVAACVKQPKPRKVEATVVTPPGGGERNDGDARGGPVPLESPSTSPPDGPEPVVEASATAATGSAPDPANGTAVAAPTADAAATALAPVAPTSAAPATSTASPEITLRNVFSGGYFKNCVWLKASGGDWTRFGCTKEQAREPGECVGLDTAFRAPLKVAPAVAGVNRFALKIETFHQTKVCPGERFAYDAGGTRLESNPNPPAGPGRKRFRCGRKAMGGRDRVKVCFEDSTDANFKDLILLFDAKGGARLEIEGIESKCLDDVKPEIENDC